MTSDPSEKPTNWLLPAKRKTGLRTGLYAVSTPVGNLGDITLRALDVLAAADLVVCEDTRVSGKLLSHYGLKKKLLPYNDHNADRQRGAILKKLKEGHSVVLISDAGTPLVSDPGYKLVRSCIEGGIPVTAIPGANAVLPALQLSGLPSDAFCFGGFLPAKQAARRAALSGWKNAAATLIFYETAPRLAKALADILETLGDREMAVAREMTKMFEEVRRGRVSGLLEFYSKEGPPKGEIVLVVGCAAVVESSDDHEAMLRAALKTSGTKQAAAAVAGATGKSRKELYALALRIADEDE